MSKSNDGHRNRLRRVAGLVMSCTGVLITVALAVLGSQQAPPGASTQGLLAFVAVISQIGAAWVFSAIGRPDPALAKRAVDRLFRSASLARVVTREIEDLFETKRTPNDVRTALGRIGVKASFLTEETIAAIEDWETFAPKVVANAGTLGPEPNPLQPTPRGQDD